MRSGEVVPRGPPPVLSSGGATPLCGRSEHDADPELGDRDRLDHGRPAPCAAELPVPSSTGSQSEAHPLTTRRSRRPFVVTPVVAALAASGDAAAGGTQKPRRSGASQCAQGDSNSTAYTGHKALNLAPRLSDPSAGVQRVHIVRPLGPSGRIGRNVRCHGCCHGPASPGAFPRRHFATATRRVFVGIVPYLVCCP